MCHNKAVVLEVDDYGVDERSYEQYEAGDLNLVQRWNLYNYARRPFDFYYEEFKRIKEYAPEVLEGLICDWGTSNGRGICDALVANEIEGTVVGLDKYRQAYLDSCRDPETPAHPDWFSFVAGRSEKAPLASNSVRLSVANFMLYAAHLAPTLTEIGRVTEDGGMAVFATNARINMLNRHAFEQEIAYEVSAKLGIKASAPPVPAASFYADEAPKILGRYGFEVIELGKRPLRQEDICVITEKRTDDFVLAVLTALASLPHEQRATPGMTKAWLDAVDHIVRPEIAKRISRARIAFENRGISDEPAFVDVIDRSAFFCINHNS